MAEIIPLVDLKIQYRALKAEIDAAILRAAGEILSLPMYPELAPAQIARVADIVRSFSPEQAAPLRAPA